MLLSGDDRENHRPAADTQNIADHCVELDRGILQHFVHAIVNAIALFGQLHPVPR